MSDTEEQSVCQTCASFEPQTWRKSLCKNCFHSLDEHSSDFLAQEAEIAAKEKVSKEMSEASTEQTMTKPDSGKPSVLLPKDLKNTEATNEIAPDKAGAVRKVQRKYGAERAAAEGIGTWSWAIDLGKEYGKPEKVSSAESSKAEPTSSSKAAAPTLSTKASPQTSTKPTSKSIPTETPHPTSSSLSAAPQTDTPPVTISKAKNFASKFENQAQSLSKGKQSTRPLEIRTGGGSNVAALTGKLSDSSSKTTHKPPEPKTTSSTTDPKDIKSSDAASKLSKTLSTATETTDISKSKTSPQTSKIPEKNSAQPAVTQSKAPPFGKDLLKSTKDSFKRESSSAGTPGKDKSKIIYFKQSESSSNISENSSDNTVEKSKREMDISIEKHESSRISSSEKAENSSINSSETKPETSETVKGKESVKVNSSTDLFPATIKKDNSDNNVEFFTERGVSEETRDENETDCSTCVKAADMDQRSTSSDFKLAENVRCSASDTGYTETGSTSNTGRQSNNTGTSVGITTRDNVHVEEIEDISIIKDISTIKDNKIESPGDYGIGVSYNYDGRFKSSRQGREDDEVVDAEDVASALSSSPARENSTILTSVPLVLSEPIQSQLLDSDTNQTTIQQQKPTSAINSEEQSLKQLDTDNNNTASAESCAVDSESNDLQNQTNINKDDDTDSTLLSISTSSPSLITSSQIDGCADATKEDKTEGKIDVTANDKINGLKIELNKKDTELSELTKKLFAMEEQMKVVEDEREQLKEASVHPEREDLETMISNLRSQLSKMEGQCSRLKTDNEALIDKLHDQETKVKLDQENRGLDSENVILEEDLEAAEKELEDVKEENKELQSNIMEMKNEMNELYDHFRESEYDEFRELQKELDITAKNCRILQFKLRKAERRNEQVEQDRVVYEEKLRALQDKFDSQDAKNHIRLLEDELRMAKEVSVRLHDELDLLEDKKNKALEESRHLTELLEHTDKRQFRMEMEIDKLRDVVCDLKRQLKDTQPGSNKESTPDRKPPLGTVGKQGSREYDVSQLMKDLYDSMERENDLKDQLKFTEEEAKMMRRRVSDMDEENENLRLQLQKMSEKASKHKKKEKERQKELDDERKHLETMKTALTAQGSLDDNIEDDTTDVILVIGPDGSEVINKDGVVHVAQRKDSTDEDLMNVLQMRVQLEMLEHELMTSHQKLDEMDLEHENLQAEVKFLQERLAEKETSGSGLPEPSTPNAYYEDKLKEMSQEADELRWKLIEKDRELERLSVTQTRHGRDHGHKKGENLKKSKSLEEADVKEADLRKQLEHANLDILRLKRTVEELMELTKELQTEHDELKNKTPIPSVLADDAAVENIELKGNLRKMEATNRAQVEKIKSLSENLQKLARDGRSYTSIATSPTVPGTLNIPNIPLVGPGTQTVLAGLGSPNPDDARSTRMLLAQLHALQQENERLQASMDALGATGSDNTSNTLTSIAAVPPQHKSDAVHPFSSNTGTKNDNETIKITSPTTDLSTKNQNQQSPTNVEFKILSEHEIKLKSSGTNMEETTSTTKNEGATSTSGAKAKVDVRDDEDDNDDVKKRSRVKESSKDGSGKSVLSEYPEGKSKVFISGSESRVELMEKVLEMDEEIGDLISMMRKMEEECDRLRKEAKHLNSQLKQVKDESRRTELDLLRELDMMHDKNSVMSNLLDIINERAEAAEEELERKMQEDTAHSPARSASNVSQVSALSDTSVGSDEVFLTAYVSKEGVITRDWETKLKIRIESLERLLAEERQKVTMAEKKLFLAGIDSVSPSISDDVKLRIREKELLQDELLKSQRHLHIATDQINGLKTRVHILEDEHARLKTDYAKLYEQMDKPHDKIDGLDENTSDTEKPLEDRTDEPPFVAKRVSVVEAPKYNELKVPAGDPDRDREKVSQLEEELQKYKQIAKELEYKVEEIDDIWRSKSSASEKERDELDKQVKEKIREIALLEEVVHKLKNELSAKEKIVQAKEAAFAEKDREIGRLTELVRSRDEEKKKIEQERDAGIQQLSLKVNTIKGLNETVRIRDERLKEKDEILLKLNTGIEKQKAETKTLTDKINFMSVQIKEQSGKLALSGKEISSSSVLSKDLPRGCQTDVEKENFRLKEAARKHQGELEKVVGEKRVLESNLEKCRKSLDEAMLMWDRDRHALQRDANILEEKVRLYEAFNSMDKEETIEALKTESQTYFREKEVLVCELSSLKLKHEAVERVHKEQVAKLQAELTDKLRLLKSEVDSNSLITTEMNRLKRQAEMAYRLQQEQRVFKAENLAMKVRYETRIDKLSKEHNKLLLAIDKLQKERDMDKQIIDTVQKNLNLVKDSYTEELVRSQEDKATLRRYVKEIEDSRSHLDELQKHIRELRDKTVDQDRLRSDLINKFATDRSMWEIDRARLNSHINQLEEKMHSSSRQQERSKDIQVNMGMAWEKERREQHRLLSEAHTLALDLQEQLRSRDEAFGHDKKELLRLIENERLAWAKEKRDGENEIMEMKAVIIKLSGLEKRLKDVQEKAGKDMEKWNKEKADLLGLATEARQAHTRDINKVEQALTKVICLRELGMMLTSQPKWDCLEEKPPDRSDNMNQSVIDYVKEAVIQICQVADDMILLTNPTTDEEAIKRISNSEIDLLKQQFIHPHHVTDDGEVTANISISSDITKARDGEHSAGVSRRLPKDTTTNVTSSEPYSTSSFETVSKSTAHSVQLSLPKKEEISSQVQITRTPTPQSSTSALRPGDEAIKHSYRSPSYASGTRSAQSSRATTPEVHDPSIGSYFSTTTKKSAFQDQASSSTIPRQNISQSQKLTTSPSAASGANSSNKVATPKRPATFVKSLSVDSGSILDNRETQHLTTLSASNTPTQTTTSSDMVSMLTAPSVITSAATHHLAVSKHSSSNEQSSRSDKLSPRSARRYFFDSYPATVSSFPTSLGYQSWPERKSVTPTLHVRQTSLPDPEEVRREAEEEHDMVSSKLESRGRYSVMKTSTSWDEQTLRRDTSPVEKSLTSSSNNALVEGTPPSNEQHSGSKPSTAKEKRKHFTKTSSLDSTIGTSIAKVGVSVMPPAAPTGFAPSEIFAAVKGKLKPVFKKKSAGSSSTSAEPRPPSPLFIQTDVPDIHFGGHGVTPVPVLPSDMNVTVLSSPDHPDLDNLVSDGPDERSRDAHRTDAPHGKWRSKSADRPQGSHLRVDIVRNQPGVWQFNETAV